MSFNDKNENLNLGTSESQNARILRYLQDGESVTSLESLWLFETMRLASRINDLHGRGVPVESVTVYRKADGINGKKQKRFSAYYLRDAVKAKYKLDDCQVETFVRETTTARINKKD